MQIEIINGTLHQWDTGRQVQVTLDEGTTLREVRFSHHRSPSPVRVAPEAGGVADIPDELLRPSGMLWVTAIVVDAYGKPQTHSRCVCTECAVRPDDYNAGGGSGGGSAAGSSDMLVVHVNTVIDMDNGTMTATPDKTFDEIWNVVRPEGWPAVSSKTPVFLHVGDNFMQYNSGNTDPETGIRYMSFSGAFSGPASNADTYGSAALHVTWSDDGKVRQHMIELPSTYCKQQGEFTFEAPQ